MRFELTDLGVVSALGVGIDETARRLAGCLVVGGRRKFGCASFDGAGSGRKGRRGVDASLAPFPIPQIGDDRPLRTILSNSFAFGGSNASVILGYEI